MKQLTEYKRLRRLGFSKHKSWENSGMQELLDSFFSAVMIIAAALAVLAVYSWVQTRDLQEQESHHKQISEENKKLKTLLADLLNGVPVRDGASGVVMFVEVSEQRGL